MFVYVPSLNVTAPPKSASRRNSHLLHLIICWSGPEYYRYNAGTFVLPYKYIPMFYRYLERICFIINRLKVYLLYIIVYNNGNVYHIIINYSITYIILYFYNMYACVVRVVSGGSELWRPEPLTLSCLNCLIGTPAKESVSTKRL